MIEILDGRILIEQVMEKHKKLLDTYGNEFSEIENKMNSLKQQSDAIKKEIESTESRISVLTEKYHLLFYQAKKQREERVNALIEKMRQVVWEDGVRQGQPVFTLPVALSIMVFFALCCQCGATVVTVRQETRSWAYAVGLFTYMTVLAYVMALVVYQMAVLVGL